ncbi:MAG: ferrochelatase [Acidobacteriaceae bacterium]
MSPDSTPPIPQQPRTQPEANASTSATLLLAHGTPDRLSEMAEYLQKVTGGRPMPPHVIAELQHRYAQIGLTDSLPSLGEDGLPLGPPLTRWTMLQARLLQQALDQQHLNQERSPEASTAGHRVYVAMRNWRPFIADVVARMKADGVRHARALCLAPQNSRTSTGLYRRALMAAVGSSFSVDFISGWADEPLLAQAFAERIWPVWAEACARTSTRVPILFTAHSVPCRTIMTAPSPQPLQHPASYPAQRPAQPTGSSLTSDGIQDYGNIQAPDAYPVECKQTAMAVATALRPVGLTDTDWFFAFQSQGIAGAPWIGPTVPDTLKALAESGHKGVVMQPVSFLCDHVEILYDIDIDFKQQATDLGLELWRAPSLNDSPTLIRAILGALRRPATRLSPDAEDIQHRPNEAMDHSHHRPAQTRP